MGIYSPILTESHDSKSFVLGLWLALAAAPAVAGWDRHAEATAAQGPEAQTGQGEFAVLPGERLAQAGSAPTATLGAVVVEAERPSLTQENLSSAEERLRLIPGGVNLIGPQALEEKRSSSLVDALGAQPGIIARSFFGGNDQARLNIRGSGLQQNPAQRGVRLLLDGLPVNLADGSFIIGVLEPRTTQYIEVYRGANGARYGATTPGGGRAGPDRDPRFVARRPRPESAERRRSAGSGGGGRTAGGPDSRRTRCDLAVGRRGRDPRCSFS